MNYQVHITKTAEHDIAKAADYIEFVLKNPQAADHLLDVATEKIGELTQMPEKLRLVDDPVLAVWGIRFIRVNNYLAFYTIDEDKKVVIIVRFLYQKSNWNTILRQDFSLIYGTCFCRFFHMPHNSKGRKHPRFLPCSAHFFLYDKSIIFRHPVFVCFKQFITHADDIIHR